MKLNLKSSNLFLLAAALFLACGQQKETADQTTPSTTGRTVVPETSLTFIDFQGKVISTLQVQLADEPEERSQGLMDVHTMPRDYGMLFIFEEERPQSFWMANTPLSLDIMYVNSDSSIVRIYQNTTPFSESSLPSGDPAMFVIETNAGYALEHGISEGMKVKF